MLLQHLTATGSWHCHSAYLSKHEYASSRDLLGLPRDKRWLFPGFTSSKQNMWQEHPCSHPLKPQQLVDEVRKNSMIDYFDNITNVIFFLKFYFRFKSNQISRSGFRIEYKTLKMSTACGGTFSDATGTLTSPLYNASYPELMDCVYLVSQPNGMFINVSLPNVDISCYGTPSDYVELRDGNTEDSPLMGSFCGNGGNIPNFMQTTQNHLRIRCDEMKLTELRLLIMIIFPDSSPTTSRVDRGFSSNMKPPISSKE